MRIKGIKKIKVNYKLIKTKEQVNNVEKIVECEKEKKQEEYNVGCFQLVVIEKVPWYKKIIRAFGKFFKKLGQKEIVLKN